MLAKSGEVKRAGISIPRAATAASKASLLGAKTVNAAKGSHLPQFGLLR